METYADYAQPDVTMRASVAMIAAPISSAQRTLTAGRPPHTVEPSTDAVSAMSWRDVAQSFAYDAAEMPIVSRLLAGQVVLALGYFGLRGALALRERSQARQMPSPLLTGLTAGVGIACAWAALALVSRTRAAPAVTVLFTYGHALRQYFPPRWPLGSAA